MSNPAYAASNDRLNRRRTQTAYSIQPLATALILLLCVLVGACAATSRARYPANAVEIISVPGYGAIRFDADGDGYRQFLPTNDTSRPRQLLALSGGGSAGAFSAGVLIGLTSSARRVEFDFVTGVSVGALIAPFAFLGPDHDPALARLFSVDETGKLFRPKNPIRTLLGESRPPLYASSPGWARS